MPPSENPFWSFSLALYARPGVAPALLGLQDRLGLDVNMLLFCCWAATVGRRLSAADIAAVDAAVAPWQEAVVRPLRVVRCRLKGGIPGLPATAVESYRGRVNDLEIEGERLAQEAMSALLPAGPVLPPSAALAVANLKGYMKARNAAIGTAEKAALAALLGGCFPQASVEELDLASD